MKFDIQKVNINGFVSSDRKWYKWKEKCDNCGEINERKGIMISNIPNTEEKDYCIICLSHKFI